MTTRSKLNVAATAASILMFVNVFNVRLGLPEWLHWILLLVMFIPLAMIFHLQKTLRREMAAQRERGEIPVEPAELVLQRGRRNLALMIGIIWLLGFCSPFWLPLTGTSLGKMGDFLVGMLSSIVATAIVIVMQRRMGRNV